MKSFTLLLLAAWLPHAFFGQTRCSPAPVQLEVHQEEQFTFDPAPQELSYLAVRLQLTGEQGATMPGNAVITQYYPGSLKPFMLLPSSIIPAALDSGQKDSAYILLEYDWEDRPYYPVRVQLDIPCTLKTGVPAEPLRVEFHCWFTPWGTVEIWGSAAFYSLKRQWLWPTDPAAGDPPRIPIHKDSIPSSDLPESLAEGDTAWWLFEPSLTFVEGLAYAVPVMRTEAPDLEDWQQQNDRAHDCGPLAQRFKYKIEGTIKSEYLEEDLSNFIDIPLSRLRVELWEDDISIADEFFGRTTTDNNGHYEISFSKCQTFAEGNEIELYINVHAYDPDKKIYGKRGNGLTSFGTGTARMTVNMGSFAVTGHTQQTFTQNVGLTQGIHLSVVQVRKAVDFCEVNNVPIHGDMNIWGPNVVSNQAGTAFYSSIDFAAVHILTNPGSRPTIHIHAWEGAENTVWHEFGHHVMNELQGDNYLNFLTAAGPHNIMNDANPQLAWAEGWASGFSFMCDLANYSMDLECRLDGNWEIERRNFQNVTNAGIGNSLTNGYQGEILIASTIYDLFDGYSMYSNYGIPTNYVIENDLGHAVDYDRWEPCAWDNVEYNLLEICTPLMDHNTPTTLLRDVDDYIFDFTDGMPVPEKLDVFDVFSQGRVCMDDDIEPTGPSADIIGIVEDVTGINTPNLFFIEPPIVVTEPVFHNIIIDNGMVFNLNSAMEPVTGRIFEDLYLQGNGQLLLNHNSQGVGGLISDPSLDINTGTPSITYYNILLEHDASIILGNQNPAVQSATLEVGENATSKAFLQVRDGSMIEVANGSKIIVNDGSKIRFKSGATLNMSDDSELIIHDGGEVIFEAGSILNLSTEADITLSDPEEDNGIQLYLDPAVLYAQQHGPKCYTVHHEHIFTSEADPCSFTAQGEGFIYRSECYEAEAGPAVQLEAGTCEVTLTGSGNFGFSTGLTYNWYDEWTNVFLGTGQTITINVWETRVIRLEVVDFNSIVYSDLVAVFKDYEANCIPPGQGSLDDVDGMIVYPNPANGPVTVSFEVLQPNDVTVSIYELDGTLLATVYDKTNQAAGNYSISISDSEFPASGTYLIVLQAGDEALQQMVVITH